MSRLKIKLWLCCVLAFSLIIVIGSRLQADINFVESIDQIKIDETGSLSPSEYPYICPAGKLHWLYGRNIEDKPITQREWGLLKDILSDSLKEEEAFRTWADFIFKIEIGDIILSFKNEFGESWTNTPQQAQIILINMRYNMGYSKFNTGTWPDFFEAFRAGDWKTCADEMEDSLWFYQVGGRSRRLIRSMRGI